MVEAPAHSGALIEEITCLTRMEQDVLEGILHWNDVDLAMEQCVSVENRSMLATEEEEVMDGPTISLVTIIPNPADDEASLVFTEPWETPVVVITYSAIGEELSRMMVPAETPRFTFNTSKLPPAVYHYRVLEHTGLLSEVED